MYRDHKSGRPHEHLATKEFFTSQGKVTTLGSSLHTNATSVIAAALFRLGQGHGVIHQQQPWGEWTPFVRPSRRQ